MPGLVAPVADEREGLLAYLGQQRLVLRLSVGGATALPLMAVVEGWPANPWVKPWEAPLSKT